ncbi:Metallophosphoesterase domain protein [Niveomyces insectorum RCEF 264]|uniref:Metallophosphoesterase domain protein n=1 Tax=Niveomyces insectorum RCEF 264 TaxID=1081102 RepID=A0A167N907_9HYPO|nr:Metallophosphoesterase domain protein [Niveomyces insectorum RCEF 264]
MSSSRAVLLRNVLRVLGPLSLLLTVYIYLYPVFGQCAFPLPVGHHTDRNNHPPHAGGTSDDAFAAFVSTLKLHLPPSLGGYAVAGGGGGGNDGDTQLDAATRRPTRLAPFRLLALGDPQLEGDTSIPNAHSASFPNLASAIEHVTFQTSDLILRERIRQVLHNVIDFWFLDIPSTVESVRKRVDLFGNDYYLAHIFRTMRWWTVPTHVAVLGDLLGSQWIEDDEFSARADRYWTRVVRGAERVPDHLALYPADEYDLSGYLGAAPFSDEDAEAWTARVINVAGNHDIGYAGDVTAERLARFEQFFGKANYELRFELPPGLLTAAGAATVYNETTNPDSNRLVPELRIINVNDMVLDTPAESAEIQDETYGFINAAINTASAVEYEGHFTVVLTHIPLFKPEGVCTDAPFFAFHDEDGSLREQNLLSEDASRGFLQGLFGMHGDVEAPGRGKGRRGVILNGHDHEGCDTYHYINQSHAIPDDEREWEAVRWAAAQDEALVHREGFPGLREITVRSMMGAFGGNAGLLSAWFDEDTWEWQFEYATCAFGREHIWWVVHVMDLVTILGVVAYGGLALAETVTQKPVAVSKTAKPVSVQKTVSIGGDVKL